MSEWKEYKIKDISSRITSGGTPSTKNEIYYGGNIPWLNTKEIDFQRIKDTEIKITELGFINSSAKWIEPNSVIVALYGATSGKVAINNIPLTTNQACCNITINELISDYRFVFYHLVNSFKELDALTSGAAQQNLNVGIISNFPILLPPLPEQRAIASVLSSLDDKIDLLHRQNKTLEAMAETLFRQWFVVSEELKVKSEKFGHLIENTFGGEWGKDNPEGDYIKPVYCIRGTDIGDLQNGLPAKTPLRYIKEKKYESIKPKDGDIIIEISGGTEDQSTGRAIYINDQIKSLFNLPLIFSNFCRLIRPLQKEFSLFLYLYLQYLYKQDEFFNLENGSSGIKNLDYKSLLFDLEYPMPDESTIIEFDEQIRIYFQRINQNKSQIRTLSALRDTLLPKLMSGEVGVMVN